MWIGDTGGEVINGGWRVVVSLSMELKALDSGITINLSVWS